MSIEHIVKMFLLGFFLGGTCLFAAVYSGGAGTSDDPYQIADANDLNTLGSTSADWDKCFILTADIDLSAYTATAYKRIGTSSIKFTGTFDGDGHTIRNLIYTTTAMTSYVGMFGYANNATIKNLRLENVQISSAGYFIGSLLGRSDTGTTIANCSATGSVSQTSASTGAIGGLVGTMTYGSLTACYTSVTTYGAGTQVGGLIGISGTSLSFCSSAGTTQGKSKVGGLTGSNLGVITDCENSGSVIATADYAGGLVGYQYTGGEITHCRNTADVSGVSSIGGIVGHNEDGTLVDSFNSGIINGTSTNIGGIVGYFYAGSITACCNTTTISGAFVVGGLAGYSEAAISNSYNTGDVSATGNYVGGLIGKNCNIVSYCYHTGGVSGSYAGGLIGNNEYGTAIACMWDTETSGLKTAAGYGPTSGMTGLCTEQMQTSSVFTDVGWDFLDETTNGTDDTWRLCTVGTSYPKLTWQFVADADFACPDGAALDDFNRLSRDWLAAYSEILHGADANGDSSVSTADLAALAAAWLQ